MSNIKNKDRNMLVSTPVPNKTKTYNPVPHINVIEKIKKYVPHDWKYKGIDLEFSHNGKRMFGTMNYKIDEIDELLSIGFRNSYDKSIPVGVCIGLRVIVCSNLMFSGDIVKTRKHTSNVIKDLDPLIKEVINQGFNDIITLQNDMRWFQSIHLPETEFWRAIGGLEYYNNSINREQLEKIKYNWFKGDYSEHRGLNELCKERTVYSLYQACTDAFKTSNATHSLKNYTKLHHFFRDYCTKNNNKMINLN